MPRPAVLVLLLVFSGCFPSSCSRTDTRALLPSDSLSRAIASEMPETSLEFVGSTDLEPVLEHPRTILFDEVSGRIYVADTRENRIAVLEPNGDLHTAFPDAEIEHPYLAGFRHGRIAVFEPTGRRIHFLGDDSVVRDLAVDVDLDATTLTYAVVNDEAIYLKIVEEDGPSRILKLDDAGGVERSFDLPGPHWRNAGMVRFWNDTLVSLSGYRPIIDRVSRDGVVDSLALRGFDSPMLSRTRRFMLGDAADPPLLTSSADVAGDRLFVLNLRAGWVQVDVYDDEGTLQRILVEPDPQPGRRFYPMDMAVARADDGSFDVYVLLVQPAPRLLHYRARLDDVLAESSLP